MLALPPQLILLRVMDESELAVNFSERIKKVQPSPTLSLNTRARELKAEGLDILNFAVGEPDYGSPQVAIDKAIEQLRAGNTRYGPAGGSLDFRRSVCRKIQQDQGFSVEPNQVVGGIGAKELLFHAFQAILNDGDEVILHAPAWVSYMEQIRLAGGKPVVIPLEVDADGEAVLNSDQLKKYWTSKTKAFVFCSPNNPGGYTASEAQIKDIADFLEDKEAWIISDEIYEAMSFDRPHISMTSLSENIRRKTLIINGCSKSFAMTGWRVGYAVGPVELMGQMKKLLSHSSSCIPPFIEAAATVAIEQGPKAAMNEPLKDLELKRKFAQDCLDLISDVKSVANHGTFYTFVDCREWLKKSQIQSTMELSTAMLEKFHVAVVPGEAFEAPGFLRFSFATDRETIQKGFERFHECLKSLSVS